MKQFLCFIVTYIFTFAIIAQNATQCRYWVNNNFAQATTITVNSETITINRNYSNLPTGYHQINFQFKQSDGLWSSPSTDWFFKGNSGAGQQGYRYWINDDFANAVTVNTTIDSVDVNIPYINAPNGYHQINFQFKDNSGVWSSVVTDWFYKAGSGKKLIKACRYWFDNDLTNVKTILLQSATYNPIITNMDVEGLSLGPHSVNIQFQDDGGVWSSVVTDLINRNPITSKQYLYPKIYLAKATINQNQSDSISGKDYTFNGAVKVAIKTLNGDLLKDTILSASSEGKIGFNYSYISTLSIGKYQLYALDINTQKTSYAAIIQIVANGTIPSVNYLKLTAPNLSFCNYTNRPIAIQWTDKATNKNNLVPNTSLINMVYKLEYSLNDGPWVFIKNYEKKALINSNVSFADTYKVPVGMGGLYKFRVVDANNLSNSDISKTLSVSDELNGFSYSLNWDKSGGGSDLPIGVCADGTSRIYLKVLKKAGETRTIATVKAEVSDLSNSNYNIISKTGKIKFATVTNTYSLEANTANSMTDQSSIPSVGNEFWFWYVAPDDFNRNAQDNFSRSREINLKVTVTYTDNSTEIECGGINIVRPPLMLVHGIASNERTWEDFSYTSTSINGSESVKKFVSDGSDLWKYIAPITLGKSESFIKNARLLLSLDDNDQPLGFYKAQSFQYFLRQMHILGYACNKVDYVCHSMGGSVVRTAINKLSTEYNPPIGYARRYKNYGKGFINKLITINTPHNGSPWGDIALMLAPILSLPEINKQVAKLYDIPVVDEYMKSFYKKTGPGLYPVYTPTDAVLNLSYGTGGVKFNTIINDIYNCG